MDMNRCKEMNETHRACVCASVRVHQSVSSPPLVPVGLLGHARIPCGRPRPPSAKPEKSQSGRRDNVEVRQVKEAPSIHFRILHFHNAVTHWAPFNTSWPRCRWGPCRLPGIPAHYCSCCQNQGTQNDLKSITGGLKH